MPDALPMRLALRPVRPLPVKALDEMKPLAPTCHCGHMVDRHELSRAAYNAETGRVEFAVTCVGRSSIGRIFIPCACTGFRSADETLLGPSAP
jgi:hypothetical protein